MNITLSIANLKNPDESLVRKIFSYLTKVECFKWFPSELELQGEMSMENFKLIKPNFIFKSVSVLFRNVLGIYINNNRLSIQTPSEEYIPYDFLKGLSIDTWEIGKMENKYIFLVQVLDNLSIQLKNCKIINLRYYSDKKHEDILRNNEIQNLEIASIKESYKLILTLFQEHLLIRTKIAYSEYDDYDEEFNVEEDRYEDRIYRIQKFIIFLLHYIPSFEQYDLHDVSIFKDIFSLF